MTAPSLAVECAHGGPTTKSVRESYDRLAEEYARRFCDELQHKPLERALPDRFAADVRGRGAICDLGCGPGHVARYLHDAGAKPFSDWISAPAGWNRPAG